MDKGSRLLRLPLHNEVGSNAGAVTRVAPQLLRPRSRQDPPPQPAWPQPRMIYKLSRRVVITGGLLGTGSTAEVPALPAATGCDFSAVESICFGSLGLQGGRCKGLCNAGAAWCCREPRDGALPFPGGGCVTPGVLLWVRVAVRG